MSILAGDLPYGVVVEYEGEPYDINDRDVSDEVTRVAVWLPEGVTVEAAEEALKDLADKRDTELLYDVESITGLNARTLIGALRTEGYDIVRKAGA